MKSFVERMRSFGLFLFVVAGMASPGSAVHHTSMPQDSLGSVPLTMEGEEGELLMWSGEAWIVAPAGTPGKHLAVDSMSMPTWRGSEAIEIEGLAGCRDSAACNFNAQANVSYPYLCDFVSCAGCTNPEYAEFDSTATTDDGSCLSKLGCTDPDAENFAPDAAVADGSCEYYGLTLDLWSDPLGTPGTPFTFAIIFDDSDSLYSEIQFFRDGELASDADECVWTCFAGNDDFEVYASANYGGTTVYTDTLSVQIEQVVSSVAVEFDLPVIENPLGTGVILFSSVDSIFVSWPDVAAGATESLDCDFTDGVAAVTGVVAGLDSVVTFSFNFIESNDPLVVSAERSAIAMSMLSPDLIGEGLSILNFVEANIESVVGYESLLAQLISTYSNEGYLDLSTDAYLLAASVGGELKALLPEIAEMPSGPCPSFAQGGLSTDWPVLYAQEDGTLRWDNCGLDIHYGVRAVTHFDETEQSIVQSDIIMFRPELGVAGRLLCAFKYNQYFRSGYSYRGSLLEDATLTVQDLFPSYARSATSTIIVCRAGDGDQFLTNAEPHIDRFTDLMFHLTDLILPSFLMEGILAECGMAVTDGVLEWFDQTNEDIAPAFEAGNYSAMMTIVQNSLPGLMEQLSQSALECGGPVAVLKLAMSFAAIKAWIAANELTAAAPVIIGGVFQVGSFSVDAFNATSYVTRQTILDGKFVGTLQLDVPLNVDGPFVNDDLTFTGNHVFEPGTSSTTPGVESLYRGWNRVGFPERVGYGRYTYFEDESAFKPYSFLAFKANGAPLQIMEFDEPSDLNQEISMLATVEAATSEDSWVYSPTGYEFNQYENDIVPTDSAGCQWLDVQFDINPAVDVFFEVEVAEAPKRFLSYHMGEPQHYGVSFESYPDDSDCDLNGESIGVFGTLKTTSIPVIYNGIGERQFVELPYAIDVLAQGNMATASVIGTPYTTYRGIWNQTANYRKVTLDGVEGPIELQHAIVQDSIPFRGNVEDFYFGFPELDLDSINPNPLVRVTTEGSCGELSFTPSTQPNDDIAEVSPNLLIYELNPDFDREVRLLPPVDSTGCTLNVELSEHLDFSTSLGKWSAILDLGECNPVTFDGYTYEVVEIGTQCWFAENLRTTVYADGTTIHGNLSDAQWTSTTSGATTVYGEGSSSCGGDCNEVANLEAYGRLYNWYAVDDSRGLCPSGWHVPTDGEWTELTNYLGGEAGAAMKSSPSDTPSWDGTNVSSFSALPGGWRGHWSGSGYFSSAGIDGHWWSASPDGTSDAWYRGLDSGESYVYKNSSARQDGFSVRCVRDE